MSMSQPIEPLPPQRDGIPAADPGQGGPDPADGFGVDGGEPDVMPDNDAPGDDTMDDHTGEEIRAGTPFRTPDPREVGPERST
jgi:hypothetical protein